MAEVSVLYDREGRTLTVWFSDRREEYIFEETGEEVVLMKDSTGRVIGFEKLNSRFPTPTASVSPSKLHRRDPTRFINRHFAPLLNVPS